MLNELKIAIIGPGIMGETLLNGLFTNQTRFPKRVAVGGPHIQHLEQIKQKFQVDIFTDNGLAVKDADLVILAIKPQRFSQVSKVIKGKMNPDALVISIIAGISLDRIKDELDHEFCIRAMPNTPARIGQGITVWAATGQTNDKQKEIARELFQRLGEEIYVEDEAYLNMATALSGTGPAYVYLFMEAMIDAGVHMGFPRRIAEQLVVKTIQGSVEFYRENQQHPAKLRNDVTSPGGTSAEALYYLEKAGFRTAISRAVWAAYERSKELGASLERERTEKGSKEN